jgi:hypothetical protein
MGMHPFRLSPRAVSARPSGEVAPCEIAREPQSGPPLP